MTANFGPQTVGFHLLHFLNVYHASEALKSLMEARNKERRKITFGMVLLLPPETV